MIPRRRFRPRNGPLRRALVAAQVALAAMAITAAHGAIGEPVAVLLSDLDGFEVREDAVGGGYVTSTGFAFAVEERGGMVYRVSGEGVLDDANSGFLAHLVGAATGYGRGIAEPVETFLANRASELAGNGPAVIGVEEYALTLDVSGEGEPYGVEFSLALQEIPAEQFPPSTHALGPADAPYVVREFSDFQCPYCADFAAGMLPVIEETLLARGDVRFEFHHFPLNSIHANAAPAAEAAECVTEANSEEAFWAFHDALFERQRAWQGLGDPAPYFVRLASELGLETAGVAECLAEGRYRSDVAEAYRIASGSLRLTGTPSVFLNGFRVRNHADLDSYLELIELVDAFEE